MSTNKKKFFLLTYSIKDDRPFPEHRDSDRNLAVIVATSETHAIERLESYYADEDEARDTVKPCDIIVQYKEEDVDQYPFFFLARKWLRGSDLMNEMEILIMI